MEDDEEEEPTLFDAVQMVDGWSCASSVRTMWRIDSDPADPTPLASERKERSLASMMARGRNLPSGKRARIRSA